MLPDFRRRPCDAFDAVLPLLLCLLRSLALLWMLWMLNPTSYLDIQAHHPPTGSIQAGSNASITFHADHRIRRLGYGSRVQG